MVLLLNNDNIAQLLTMEECVTVIDEEIRECAEGNAMGVPRVDFLAPSEKAGHLFDVGWMADGSNKWQMFCIRLLSDLTYFKEQGPTWTREKFCIQPGTYCGLVLLFSTKDARPLAIVNDSVITHTRVAGQAAVAVKLLAKKDASTIGMLGSGGMARSFAEAIQIVRNIERIKVFSPTRAHRDLYAEEMSEKLGMEVVAVNEPREAVRRADIVCTCTNSRKPVMFGDWLEPGMLVYNVGNEVDEDLLSRCHLRVRLYTESRPSTDERGKKWFCPAYFAGTDQDFAGLKSRSSFSRSLQHTQLLDIIAGKVKGRTRQDEIIQAQGGGGLGFVALTGLAYTKAVQLGVGRELPLEWFIQNLKD